MAHDDLNVLSAFLFVAEERSFTKAAKRISVSQSALSHAVRGLEEEIGVRLLARTRAAWRQRTRGRSCCGH
jgi:DNA-binding transcriptional LysR family regulator